MRKFTLFLSLIVAFVTATAQEVTVTSLDQLSNDKTYFIESARCFLMNNTTANAAGISTSTAKNLGTSTVAKDWNDANQQFKIENIDGNYYLYSVGAAKYVTKDGAWSETAVDALEITPSSNSTYNWKLCIAGNGMNSQEPSQMDAGIVVNSWTDEDPGNRYKIIDTEASTVVVVDYPNELTEFDQNKCYIASTTSRGGWAVKDGQFCSTVDADLGDTSNPEDVNQQFAILSIDGENYYLYSVGAQMFVNSDCSLVAGISEPIELADASKMGDCRVRVNFKGYTDKYINLGGDKQMIIDSWSDIDAGNAVAFIEAGEFDPTAALAMLQPATELQALEVASTERNPLETAINGQYKLQGVKINFDEVVKKYTTELSGDYGYILDAEGNEVAKLNKCMGGNGTSNTFATPYASTAIETPGTYKVVVLPGVILNADGTKEYKGGEFEFTVAERAVEISPSAVEGFCYNETFENIADFSEFVITVKYAKSDVVINNDVKATMTTGETVYEAAVTVEKSGNTQYITLAFDGEFAEGRYTINVPAGLFTVDGVANEEYAKSTFTYRKPQLEISRDFDTWESYLDQPYYMPTAAMIVIANAESVEVDESKVATITFGETVYNSTLNWYYDSWSNAYYIEYQFEDFFAEGFEFVKGDYTFTLPAGAYTVNGEANEEAVKTYTYGDPIVEEFSITEILPAPGSVLESIDAISITFSNGMAADYLPVTCGDKTYYFVSMSGVYVPVDMMNYEPIVITEPGTYTLDLSELEGLTGEKVFTWTIAEVATESGIDTSKEYYLYSSYNWGMNKGYLTIGTKSGANYGPAYMANEKLQAFKLTPTDDGGYTLSREADMGGMSYTEYIDCTHAYNVANNAMSGSTLYFELNTNNKYYIRSANGYFKADMISYGTDGYAYHVFSNGDMTSALEWELIPVEDVVEPEQPAVEPLKYVSHTPAEPVESISEVTITFDREVGYVSSDMSNVKLKLGSSTTRGMSSAINGNSVTIYLSANVNKSGEYTLEIPADIIKATDGGVFAGTTLTIIVDAAPALTSKTTVNVNNTLSVITAEFDTEIEFAAESNVTVLNVYVQNTETVAGTITVANNATIEGNVLTLTLDEAIVPESTTKYTVEIPAGWIVKKGTDKAFAGKKLTYTVKIPFAVKNITPANGSTVEVLENIVVEFNEAIYNYMLNSLKLVNTADNSEIALNGVAEGNILTLTPNSDVASGTYRLANIKNIVNNSYTPAEEIEYTITVNTSTAIEEVETEVENDVIYDLTGRKIETITKGGIYIVNGKKVLVK